MKVLAILTLTTSFCLATSEVDHGISLIYQGKSDEALAYLKPLSNKGDVKASFYTSLLLIFGDKPNISEGMPYLKNAVNAGYGPALDTIAGLYLHGDIIPKDIHTAKMYYDIAAQRGYGPSQFNFGIMSKNGDSMPRDLEDAYVYLSLASDNISGLGDLTIDATKYRNEVRAQLNQEELDRAHQKYERLRAEIATKEVSND